MDATQRKLVRGLKGLIIEIQCGKLDRMSEPEYKLFLEGLSLIIEAKKTDYGHHSINHGWGWNFRNWLNYLIFQAKAKAHGSRNRGEKPD